MVAIRERPIWERIVAQDAATQGRLLIRSSVPCPAGEDTFSAFFDARGGDGQIESLRLSVSKDPVPLYLRLARLYDCAIRPMSSAI